MRLRNPPSSSQVTSLRPLPGETSAVGDALLFGTHSRSSCSRGLSALMIALCRSMLDDNREYAYMSWQAALTLASCCRQCRWFSVPNLIGRQFGAYLSLLSDRGDEQYMSLRDMACICREVIGADSTAFDKLDPASINCNLSIICRTRHSLPQSRQQLFSRFVLNALDAQICFSLSNMDFIRLCCIGYSESLFMVIQRRVLSLAFRLSKFCENYANNNFFGACVTLLSLMPALIGRDPSSNKSSSLPSTVKSDDLSQRRFSTIQPVHIFGVVSSLVILIFFYLIIRNFIHGLTGFSREVHHVCQCKFFL